MKAPALSGSPRCCPWAGGVVLSLSPSLMPCSGELCWELIQQLGTRPPASFTGFGAVSLLTNCCDTSMVGHHSQGLDKKPLPWSHPRISLLLLLTLSPALHRRCTQKPLQSGTGLYKDRCRTEVCHEQLLNEVNMPHHLPTCSARDRPRASNQTHEHKHIPKHHCRHLDAVHMLGSAKAQPHPLQGGLRGFIHSKSYSCLSRLPASYLIPEAKPQHNGAAGGLTSPHDQHSSSSPRPWKASLPHAPARFVQIQAIPRQRQKAKCM